MKKKKILIFTIITLVIVFSFIFINNSDFLKLRGTVNYTNSYVKNSIKITEETENNFNDNDLSFFVNDIKLLNIAVQVPDGSNLNSIEINLAEGMNYVSYPVKTDGNQTKGQFEKVISESDTLNAAVLSTNSDGIIKESRTNLTDINGVDKSIYGTIIYNVSNEIKEIVIPINVGVDFFRYYVSSPEKKIENALRVKANYDNKIVESSIDINLTAYIDGVIKINSYLSKTGYNSHTTDKLPSTATEDSFGVIRENDMFWRRLNIDANVLAFIPYYKKAEFKMYYPKNTTFVDILDRSSLSFTQTKKISRHGLGTNEYCKIVSQDYYNSVKNTDEAYCYVVDYNNNNNSNENYVIVYVSKYTNSFSGGLAVKYRVNNVVANLTVENAISWTSSEYDVIKTINYDDTVSEYNSSSKNTLTIHHADSIDNKIQATKYNKEFYNKEDMIVFSPSFVIKNTTFGDKVNQILEFEIPARFEAFKVNIPKYKDARFLSIEYKSCNKQTNICDEDWVELPKEIYDKYKKDSIFYFKNTYVDEANYDNIYFTNVRAKVDYFPEGYKSTAASPMGYSNAVVYGTFKKDVDKEIIKLKLCNGNAVNYENDCTQYEASAISNVGTATEKREVGIYTNKMYLYNENNVKLNAITGGERFKLSGEIGPHVYPYGTLLNSYNTIIYLREPKGYTIEIDDLVLKMDSENVLPYNGEPYIKKITRENDSIYVINTNKVLGHTISKIDALNNHNRFFTIDVKYLVNEDFDANPNVLNITDLITFDGTTFENSDEKVYVNSGQTKEDLFNIDLDDQTSKIGIVGVDRIAVHPKDGFIVSSTIVKDGEEYLKYNENNQTTFTDIFISKEQSYQDSFTHKIRILNNTKEELKAGTELYIPIAKEGYKYFYLNNKNERVYIQDNFDGLTWDSIFESIDLNTNLFDVYVASLPNNDSKEVNVTSINYSSISSIRKENVGLIKLVIKSGKKIKSKDVEIIYINQKASDAQNKHLSENVYRPILNVKANTLDGIYNGNKVGLKLYEPVITLDFYHDVNGNDKKDSNENYIYDENITVELLDANSNVVTDSINKTNNNTYYVVNKKLKPKAYAFRIKLNNSTYKFLSTANKTLLKENININSSNRIYAIEQGLINYNLGFTVPEEVKLYFNETKTIKIKDISPEFYSKIANFTLDFDKKYINASLNGDEITLTSEKQSTDNDFTILKVTLRDKYGNSEVKEVKVKVLSNVPPIVEDGVKNLLVNEVIDFPAYVKAISGSTGEAIDIKITGLQKDEEEINTFYKFNPAVKQNMDGNYVATKEGDYEIKYIVVEKLYAGISMEECLREYTKSNYKSTEKCLAGIGTVKLHVSPIPVTVDNIIVYIILFAGSIIGFIVAIIIAIKNKKNR